MTGRSFVRFFPLYALALFYVGLGFALRVVLFAQFGAHADVHFAQLPGILLAGVVNDAVESLYLLAPLALYILLLPDRWYRSRLNRYAIWLGAALSIAVVLYLAAVEYFFFQEFDARFNIVAFDYLMYPTEVIGDIRAAYPVGATAAATLLATGALLWLARRFRRLGFEEPTAIRARLSPFALHAAALGAAIAFFATDALSWSSNRVASELAQNGYSSFFRAASTSEIDYHSYYASADPHQNLELLAQHLSAGGGTFTRLAEGRLDREFAARTQGLGRLNVVVVAVESFGAEFSRLHGSRQDATPNFDAFAQKGLWFANTYASGTRTVRGLEAITSSFPPIPTVSILRRPNNQHIATWGSVMQDLGYHTSFLYGGYGYFDNMNAFYGGNDFEVLDRRDIPHPRFENIWGVSDEDLFDRALQHFDAVHAGGKPFFSIVMTTSNHKPFTFRKGLDAIGVPEQGGGRLAGVRYADFAIGEFLRHAASHPWFDDTVFVVVADHGARVYGKAQIPLRTYEIPLMIYAPKHLAPRRIDTLMTQIDIAPTVLGLLGLPYQAPFFGQDVLSTPESNRIAVFNHNHDVAIYRDGKIMVFGLHKSVDTWRYDRAADRFTPAPADPALQRLGIAYYQTAYELFSTHRYESSPPAPGGVLVDIRAAHSRPAGP
jgi:phosphoglycerol transferase MdoB-like AlkP superfamily enzyme